MSVLIFTLLISLYIWAIGALICLFLKKVCNKSNEIKIGIHDMGLWWCIGAGAVTLELLYFSWIRIPWSIVYITVPWMILLGIFIVQKMWRIKLDWTRQDTVVALIFISLSSALSYVTITIPIWEWDGLAIWNFKAQAFFIMQNIPLNFLKDPQIAFAHLDYPLLIPLLQTWYYQHLGSVNVSHIKIIYPLFYLSFLFVTYGILSRISKRILLSFAFTLLIGLTPYFIEFLQWNYADAPLAIFLTLSIAYLLLWGHDRKSFDLLIGLALLGLAAFTKSEGQIILLFIVMLLTIALIFKKDWSGLKLLIIFSIITLPLWLPWAWYARHFVLGSNNGYENINVEFIKTHHDKLPIIQDAMYHELKNYLNWGAIWILFLATGILSLFWRPKYIFLFLSIGILVLIYGSIYYFSPHNLQWHLITSLNRLVVHLSIPTGFVISYALLTMFDTKKS